MLILNNKPRWDSNNPADEDDEEALKAALIRVRDDLFDGTIPPSLDMTDGDKDITVYIDRFLGWDHGSSHNCSKEFTSWMDNDSKLDDLVNAYPTDGDGVGPLRAEVGHAIQRYLDGDYPWPDDEE